MGGYRQPNDEDYLLPVIEVPVLDVKNRQFGNTFFLVKSRCVR